MWRGFELSQHFAQEVKELRQDASSLSFDLQHADTQAFRDFSSAWASGERFGANTRVRTINQFFMYDSFRIRLVSGRYGG